MFLKQTPDARPADRAEPALFDLGRRRPGGTDERRTRRDHPDSYRRAASGGQPGRQKPAASGERPSRRETVATSERTDRHEAAASGEPPGRRDGVAACPRHAAPAVASADASVSSLSRIDLAGLGEGWLCSSYADVRQILTDPRFDAAPAGGSDSQSVRLTAVAVAGLKPRHVERLRPAAVRTADALLGGLAGPPADLVAEYVKPLSADVLCDLLRIPGGARGALRALLLGAASTDEPRPVAAKQASKTLARGLSELVAVRSGTSPDLLSAMIRVRGAGADRLSDQQLVAIGLRLLIPGLQNTVLTTANLIRTLLRHPDALDRLAQHPELVPAAVEELLRVTPFHSTASFPRYATEDTRVGATAIGRGDLLVGSLSAANHDARVFAAPTALDLGRRENPHLTFGMGPHYCPGAALARMQCQVAIGALVSRLGTLREVAASCQVVGWNDELRVTWS
jgi:cytochrome P450